MYKLNANARDHFNCSPLLFSWPAPRNRCGQTERGQWYQHCRSLYWILLWMRPKIWLALLYASSHCFLTFKSLEKKTIPRSFKDWASSSCCPHNRYCLCHSGPLPLYIYLLEWSARPTQPICHRHQQLVAWFITVNIKHFAVVELRVIYFIATSVAQWCALVANSRMLCPLFKLSHWKMALSSCYTASDTCSVSVLLLCFFWLLN